jgi:2-polyprenyl-3-methyl-5-hydroxy-6-metoxy-1,4-benzoquinol methylase
MKDSTFDLIEIDKFIDRISNASSETEISIEFANFTSAYDLDVPTDPFSKVYREKQFTIYSKLTGLAYSNSNEKSSFCTELAAVRPFPYFHESCGVVGNHLMAIGFIIKNLQLPPNARILEFGPGWGNLTIALAKMGFQVTAVDIEKNFIDLIKQRASMEQLDIQLIHDDFSFIHMVEEPYDAILFFECFHHASNHLALMAAFDKAVKKNGIVCFASEPISDDFPIPWGLRMDGQSLWAIRKNGWLELGFNKKYFTSALERYGWRGLHIYGVDSPNLHVIVAKRKIDWEGLFNYSNKNLKNKVGRVTKNGCISDGNAGYLAYGPYINLPAGSYCAELLLNATVVFLGKILVDVVIDNGATCLSKLWIESNSITKEQPINILFDSDNQMHNLEIRVWLTKDTSLYLEAINITAR